MTTSCTKPGFLYKKSLVKEFSRDLTPNEMCFFTDFVTFSNARNDTCFVNQAFRIRIHGTCMRKSLVNKTGIISSVAKSDEIGKKAHLAWCKNEISRETSHETSLTRLFIA